MLKIGDMVKVTGGEYKGLKGPIIGRDKMAQPGEPQEIVWVVRLPDGRPYKFYEEQLKLINDE